MLRDDTGGRITEAVRREATHTVDEARRMLLDGDQLDGYVNMAYRALKSDRDGRALERRLDAAAACTTASQPSSARVTESASSTSPVDHVVGREGHAVRVERLGHLLRTPDEQPYVVPVAQQGQHDVRADVPGSTRDQNAHARCRIFDHSATLGSATDRDLASSP